jgi:hypothetical protein
MRKAVLSISGNVYKQQQMEIDKLINDDVFITRRVQGLIQR